MKLKKIRFAIFAFLSMGMDFGLLASKSKALLANIFWNVGFYTHISCGGLALQP